MNGSMFIGTWWALVPPLLAILLAFVTKEVYSSLFIGSAVGVLLYTGFHPWDAFTSFFEILRNSMNINILIFDILLGMVVVLMAKSGGSAAYGKWAGTKIKTKRSALLATMGLGVLIFVDDYFNCLTVGSVMRPVTDATRFPARNSHTSSTPPQRRSVLSRRSQAGRQPSTRMCRRMRESVDSSCFCGQFRITCMRSLQLRWSFTSATPALILVR